MQGGQGPTTRGQGLCLQESTMTRDSVRDTENLLLCVNSLHFNIGILFKKSPPNKIALIRAFN